MSSGTSLFLCSDSKTNHSSDTNLMQLRTMQSDEDFNIRFVNYVKMHKCLYDKKIPEYRNREYQEKAWMIISKETQESVIHCKERWRNLRACLSRYIKLQHGNDPQHKPYYLAEHMSFLLPFLKPIRTSLDSNNSSHSGRFQLNHSPQRHPVPQFDLYKYADQQTAEGLLEMKHSLSDNDEETIDAFDNGNVANKSGQNSSMDNRTSLSDTNSTNAFNLIPVVQIHTQITPERDSNENICSTTRFQHSPRKSPSFNSPCHQPKRHKTDPQSPTTSRPNMSEVSTNYVHDNSRENADMEFFRSILPDIAELTPQQRRKFKIGILELIDEVVTRYPSESTSVRDFHQSVTSGAAGQCSFRNHNGAAGSIKEWRK